MRQTYWMLGVFTFIILLAFFFVFFPAFLVVIGFFIGMISIYFDKNPLFGEMVIKTGTFFWRHALASLIGVIVATFGFLFFTDRIHKSSRFRKIKYMVKKKAK